jgi:formiminotetrahydrofolate cyclodeaminase
VETSIWAGTLESFLDRVAGPESVPASVSAAAVTASFAAALLVKVLEITGKRKNFSGDRAELVELIEAARREKATLARAAEEDIQAFRSYMLKEEGAMRKVIEVPMSAARSALRSLELCTPAVELASPSMIADVAGAALLLSGAVRTILVSVDSNLRQFREDADYCAGIMSERRALEDRARQLTEQTLTIG